MVGVTFGDGYQIGVNDVLEVTLLHKNIVNEVLLLGLWMHPGFFKYVFLLEDGVGNDKLLLSAKLQLSRCRCSNKRFSVICTLAHSNIEITKDCHLKGCYGDSCGAPSRTCLFLEVQVEELERTHWKAWHIAYFSTEDSLISCGWNDQLADFPVRRWWSYWHMEPTPERRPSVVGYPDQKRVYLVPCSWRLPSLGKRTSLRAAMLTFNRNSSYEIRVERHSGRSMWTASIHSWDLP